MNDSSSLDSLPSSGVEELIRKLREAGVVSGRKEGEQLVASARHEAEGILQQAKTEAEAIISKAREEAEMIENAGKEALKSSMRDTVLKMKGHLSTRFSEEIRRLISTEMAQEAFLERLILEVAARARRDISLDEAEQIEILLPEDVVGMDELRAHPEKLHKGTLSHFVLSVTNDLLRDGVVLRSSDKLEGGIRIILHEGEIQVDLTPDKVAEVLLEHLHPRFRSILEGTVK